ncbi:DUF185-domain-containing protein [Ramicandelaber brevisporus]|nr:DUF185-domain-containing protein [Ramicandelaber brevisporus]
MLVREYIDNALYNPHYGYFSKTANIASVPESFDVTLLKDSIEFENKMAERYEQLETKILQQQAAIDTIIEVHDNMAAGNAMENAQQMNRMAIARQMWHTPTEIFSPWYARSIARYMSASYKVSGGYPHQDLLIFEMGAGNGTMATEVLNYLREIEPDIYARTQYTIIEISQNLAKRQAERLAKAGHMSRMSIVNKSVFDWNKTVTNPCFFLALEVIDNFAHDVIRYNNVTDEPYQGVVLVDHRGRMEEVYESVSDPLIEKYMNNRRRCGYRTPLLENRAWRQLRQQLPFAPNLTRREFVPTRQLDFLQKLNTHFPHHRLILSDFSALPDAVDGIDAPVVQTRFQGLTVPCNTHLVQPGWFDIFFPTNFGLLADMHSLVRRDMGLAGDRPQIVSHSDFVRQYAEVERTTTRNGDNPMVSYYENVSFLLS